jgi:hypothetical protein
VWIHFVYFVVVWRDVILNIETALFPISSI